MQNNNKIDRPEGVMAKHYKLVTDVNSMPNGMTPDMFVKLYDAGHVFYDSEKGIKPKLYCLEPDSQETPLIEFHDTEGKVVDVDLLMKKLEDEEFWRKELYKCKQSPLYYFVNYVSETPKPTQQEIDNYLHSQGFDVKDDSDEAADVDKRTIEIREKFSEQITLEGLKNLKPVRDRIDQEYLDETERLQELAANKFELSKTNEKGIRDKVTTTIMKTKPADAPIGLLQYINERTGRWDKQMFRVTDFDVLLRLWMLL